MKRDRGIGWDGLETAERASERLCRVLAEQGNPAPRSDVELADFFPSFLFDSDFSTSQRGGLQPNSVPLSLISLLQIDFVSGSPSYSSHTQIVVHGYDTTVKEGERSVELRLGGMDAKDGLPILAVHTSQI